MRLLLPQIDKERQTYGMKETNLAKFYVEILDISPNSPDAKLLLNWRKPTSSSIQSGDFGNAVYVVLKSRCNDKSNVTIAQVNTYLDQLNTTSNRKDKTPILKALLKRCTAIDQKWVVRIILKELKIGISEKTILNYFHPNAIELLNVTSNLRKVCEDLQNPEKRISYNQNISLFNPIKPMLASRQTPANVIKINCDEQFAIETKFDGERIQVHKNGNEIKLYSRNSNDCTNIYGSKLIPILRQRIVISKCILDGELVVWDSLTEKFEPFGKLKTTANFGRSPSDVLEELGNNLGKQLCFIVFDLLFVKHKAVIQLTYQQRTQLLRRCVKPKKKLLEIMEPKVGRTIEHIVEALDHAISHSDEGIIIKSLSSPYVPDERKTNWIKIKPEYINGLGDDLDVIILGGYYGTGVGRRGGTVSHFLVGVSTFDENGNRIFHSLAKVGSGYSDSDLKVLQGLLGKYWRVYNTQNPPSCFLLADGFKEKPDVWVEPQNSKILQIKAAQIVPSEKYKTGYTLRFPRVVSIRLDKEWTDCLDLGGLLDLTHSLDGRYASKRKLQQISNTKSDSLSIGTISPKKRKITLNISRRTNAVRPDLKGPIKSEIHEISNLFKGEEYCVKNGDEDHPKQELELIICQHGGNVVQHPTIDTKFVIAASKTLSIKNIIKMANIDVVHYKWLLLSLEQETYLNLEPKYMIHTKPETKEVFLIDIDRYGDYYEKETTVNSLKEVFQAISYQKNSSSDIVKQEDSIPNSNIEDFSVDKLDIEKQHFDQSRPWWGLFREYVFYVDRYQKLGSADSEIKSPEIQLLCYTIEFYGGLILDKLTSSVTHIIVLENDLTRISYIRKKLKFLLLKPPHMAKHIVTQKWVEKCIEEHQEKEEYMFYPQKT